MPRLSHLLRHLASLAYLPAALAAQTAVPCPKAGISDREVLQTLLTQRFGPHAALGRTHLVCGSGDLAVASAWLAIGEDPTHGPTILTVRRHGRSYQIVDTSRGMRDAALPDFRLFRVGDRRLVVADVGSEGPWGLQMFELRTGHLIDLGIARVALPPPFEEDPAMSGLNRVQVAWGRRGWELRFDTVVVFSPGTRETVQQVPDGTGYIVLRRDDPMWDAPAPDP